MTVLEAKKMNLLNNIIDNTYDMMRGCMNRICITDDDEERENRLTSIDYYKVKLADYAKCRAHNGEGFDEIHAKYTPKPSKLKL